MTDEQRKAAIRKGLAGAIEDWLGQDIPEAERLAQYILDELKHFAQADVVEAAGRFFNGSFTTHDPETRNAWRDIRGALAKVQLEGGLRDDELR